MCWMSYTRRPELVVLAYKHAQKVPEYGHVERLKVLTLVACAIAVESKHSGGPLKGFHSKSDADVDGNLGANKAPEKLTNDTRNGATTEYCKGMAEAVMTESSLVIDNSRLAETALP